jgi:hypothetical protein
VGRILDVAARQANACRDAADQLAYLHGELEDTRVPAYDVPTALEVLQTGMLTHIEGVWSQKCSQNPWHGNFNDNVKQAENDSRDCRRLCLANPDCRGSCMRIEPVVSITFVIICRCYAQVTMRCCRRASRSCGRRRHRRRLCAVPDFGSWTRFSARPCCR